jgi:hypothetical protein
LEWQWRLEPALTQEGAAVKGNTAAGIERRYNAPTAVFRQNLIAPTLGFDYGHGRDGCLIKISG